MFNSHIMEQKQYVGYQYCGRRLISPYCSFFSRFPCLLSLLINKKTQLLLQALRGTVSRSVVLRMVIEVSLSEPRATDKTWKVKR